MKTEPLPIYPTMRAASGATGFSLTTLRKFKNAGCPAFTTNGRVSLEKLVRWLADRHAGPDIGVDWPARLKKAQAEREEIRLAKDRGQVVTRAEVTACIAGGQSILYGELDREFINELPPILVGLDALTISRKCRESVERVRCASRDKFEEWESREMAENAKGEAA